MQGKASVFPVPPSKSFAPEVTISLGLAAVSIQDVTPHYKVMMLRLRLQHDLVFKQGNMVQGKVMEARISDENALDSTLPLHVAVATNTPPWISTFAEACSLASLDRLILSSLKSCSILSFSSSSASLHDPIDSSCLHYIYFLPQGKDDPQNLL